MAERYARYPCPYSWRSRRSWRKIANRRKTSSRVQLQSPSQPLTDLRPKTNRITCTVPVATVYDMDGVMMAQCSVCVHAVPEGALPKHETCKLTIIIAATRLVTTLHTMPSYFQVTPYAHQKAFRFGSIERLRSKVYETSRVTC